MFRLEKSKPGSARHRGCDGDEIAVRIGKFCQRFADYFGIGWAWRRRRFACLELIFAESVELVGLGNGWLVAFAFLGQNMQQHRLILRLEKFKGFDEQRNIVSIDGTVVAQSKLLEDDAWYQMVLYAFLNIVRQVSSRLPGDGFHETPRFRVY